MAAHIGGAAIAGKCSVTDWTWGEGRGSLRPEGEAEKLFHVHPLVTAVLGHRETSDYGLLERLGDLTVEKAGAAEGLTRLALAQEGNRLLFEAHRVRNRMRTLFPDHDPALESIRGMVRSKKPRFDLAEQRLVECLDLDPMNPEMQLMFAELAVTKQIYHSNQADINGPDMTIFGDPSQNLLNLPAGGA